MRKIIIVLVALGSYCHANAQLTNAGQLIHLETDAVVVVNDSYLHKGGVVSNNGTLAVKGNWTNNDISSVVFNNDSEGTVLLNGNSQEIGGSSTTAFPSLTLSKPASGAMSTFSAMGPGKWLSSNIAVKGVLSLQDQQLHAEFNTIHVINADADAITRTSGFISTDNFGALIRNTNSNSPYLFPLGSVNSTTVLYRPLSFQPKNSLENTFSATLNFNDPTSEGFDKAKKRHDIQSVWDKYYFVLGQKSGNSGFDINFYQNSEEEKSATQLVHWEKYFSVWGKASPSTVTSGSFGDDLSGKILNTSILYSSTETFSNMPFTFSGSSGLVNPFTFYNGFSPDGDGKNDQWNIKNIELYPDNKLSIFNRWGDEVYNAKGYTNATAWDGANVQSGTYYYVLNVTVDGAPQVYKGFITMIKKD